MNSKNLSNGNNWFLNISHTKITKKDLKSPIYLTENFEYLEYMTKKDKYENSKGFNEFYLYQIELNPRACIFGFQENDIKLLEKYLSKIRQLKFKSEERWGKLYTREEIIEILQKHKIWYITEADFMKRFYKQYGYDGFVTEEDAGYTENFKNLCILNIDMIDSIELTPIDDPEDAFRLDDTFLKNYKLQELERVKPGVPKNLWLIGPQGKIYTLDGYHFHGGFIKDNIDLFDFDEEEKRMINKSKLNEISQVLLLRKKWITARSDGMTIDFCTSKKNFKVSNQIIDFLLELGSDYNIKKIYGASVNYLDTDRLNCYDFIGQAKFYSIEQVFQGDINNRIYEHKILSFKELLKLNEIVSKNQEFARIMAQIDLDDNGVKRKISNKPHWTHTQSVADIVEVFGGSEEQIIAAEMHDNFEDGSITSELLENNFGDKVTNLVIELTNFNNEIKKVGKENYMNNKLVNLSKDALLIKLADFYSNLGDSPSDNQRDRMINNLKFLARNRKMNKKCIRILRSLFSLLKMKGWN